MTSQRITFSQKAPSSLLFHTVCLSRKQRRTTGTQNRVDLCSLKSENKDQKVSVKLPFVYLEQLWHESQQLDYCSFHFIFILNSYAQWPRQTYKTDLQWAVHMHMHIHIHIHIHKHVHIHIHIHNLTPLYEKILYIFYDGNILLGHQENRALLLHHLLYRASSKESLLGGGGASFKKGTSFLIQEMFLFKNSLGSLYFLQGINYGRRPTTTILLFTFVIRTKRGFMDGPGSEKHGPFAK